MLLRFDRNNPLITVINQSDIAKNRQVERMVKAIQRQVTEHFRPAWGLQARLVFNEEPPLAMKVVIKDKADIELLGIAQDEGKRESVEIADGRFVKNMSILNVRTDVTFYPVVRQKFKLNEGGELVLYSFRFPKVALPQDFTRIVLNEAAVERKKKPSEMRFGGTKPEMLEIRGARALLFESEGVVTVYWQEDGIGHTAAASLPRKELFQIIEDLL